MLEQQRALQARLATLEIDARWEPAGTYDPLPASWGESSGVGFFLRAAGSGVEIVRADRGNRRATVVMRLAGRMPSSDSVLPLRWLRAIHYGEAAGDLVAFEGDGFFWAGPTPRTMLDDSAAEADEACERYEVSDADGETTLRVGPSSRSAAATVLANGTEVHVAMRDGRWLSVDHPHRGWLFARNVRCIE